MTVVNIKRHINHTQSNAEMHYTDKQKFWERY